MENVFYQIFDGDTARNRLAFDEGTAYAEAADRAVDAEEKLRITLNDEQRELLRAYSAAEADMHELARREDFAAGMKLGARLVLAFMDDTPGMIHQVKDE